VFTRELKNKTFTLTLYLITVISIFLLITYQAIYPTIIPMIKNGSLHLFADWSVILNANICSEKGYDVIFSILVTNGKENMSTVIFC